MYLKNNKDLELIELNTTIDRFKGLKLVLEPLDYIIKFPNKKIASTYFLCQKIDIIMTNKENKILKIVPNVKSEKIIFPVKGVKDIYFFPLKSSLKFKIGEKLEFIKK